MVLLVPILLWLVVGAGLPALAERAGPPVLTDLSLANGVQVVADIKGRLLSWEPAHQRFTTWTAAGKRDRDCTLDDPQLSGRPGLIGFSNDRVLATFFDPDVSTGHDRRRLVVVDVRGCRVASSLSLPDVVQAVQPARDGWLVTLAAVGTPRFRIVHITALGKVAAEFAIPEELREEIAQRFQHVGASNLLAVDAGREIWIIPRSIYSFWRPRQLGKPDHSFRPASDCIKADGRELSGDDSKRELERMIKAASGPNKQALSEFLKRAGDGGKGFVGSIAAATSYGDRVALAVRDSKNGTACRIDVWDLSLEALLAVYPIAVPVCPASLSLTDDGIWFSSGGGMRRIDLPNLAQVDKSLKDPCEWVKREPVATVEAPPQ